MMKKKHLAVTMGIMMSMAVAATGCANSTGAGTSAASGTQAAAEAGQNTASDAAANTKSGAAENAGADAAGSTEPGAAGSAEPGASGNAESSASENKGKKARKKKDSSDAAARAAQAETVETSAYAGQKVRGEIVAVDGQNITILLSEGKSKEGTEAESAAAKKMTIAVTDEVTITSADSHSKSGGKKQKGGSTDSQSQDEAAPNEGSSTTNLNYVQLTAGDAADSAANKTYTISDLTVGTKVSVQIDDQGKVTTIKIRHSGHGKEQPSNLENT
ncbi:MAG: hypothetical protein Q4F25_00695 [Eubacteriales bacterium]|nr:hypothetical protein [Eubacteriales bacterium]